jgi:ketosteroid isomerase-like protein
MSFKTATIDVQASVAAHLSRFDDLDFEAFNKQQWDLFNQIHAEDVVVTFPDGHQTTGIDRHDADMKALFAWAPDMKVTAHPIKFGAGAWTAVTGVLTGTFTRPMSLAQGPSIPPTGKSFTVPMCTIAHWKDSRIVEETLFWDSGAMMQQIGVAM